MPKPDSPGAALVRLRWAKTTPEERSEHGRRLALARWGPGRAKPAKPDLAGAAEAFLRRLQKAQEDLRASQEGNSPPSNPVDPKV